VGSLFIAKQLSCCWGYALQRLFSTFAGGWPGAGLLLQRLLLGGSLIYSAISSLNEAPQQEISVLELLGAAAGAMIIAGLWTPVAGIFVSAVQGWIAFTRANPDPAPIVLAVLGLTLAMIGPGAWSIDARLFGRKEILF
jgi:putative oxidoreductase